MLRVANHLNSYHLEPTNDKLIGLNGTNVHFYRTMSQTQTHTDSVDGRDHDEVEKKPKSRRPASMLITFSPSNDP